MSLIEKKVKFNGITTFWSLTDNTDREKLLQGLTGLGRADLIPSPKKDTQALLRALNKQFSGKETVIKSIKGTSGYTICAGGKTSDGRDQYTENLRVTFDDNGNLVFKSEESSLGSLFSWAQSSVEQEFNRQRGLVSSAALGTILSEAARSLSGIALRPRGGFYWIPQSKKDKWEQIISSVVSAGLGNEVYCLQTTTDKSTVTAVCNSLVAQVENKLDQLESDIEEGDLGKRALATRKKEALELDSLLQEYEGILGTTMTSLRTRAEDAETAAAMAIFDAMAADG